MNLKEITQKAWSANARSLALIARQAAQGKATAMAEVGTPTYSGHAHTAVSGTGPTLPTDPRKVPPELAANGGARDSHAVATHILQQYGGNRMVTMTGATNITHGNTDGRPHLTFKIPRRNGITHVKTVHHADDTYSVHMIGVHGTKISEKHVAHGLHAAQLANHFTRHTGLETKL